MKHYFSSVPIALCLFFGFAASWSVLFQTSASAEIPKDNLAPSLSDAAHGRERPVMANEDYSVRLLETGAIEVTGSGTKGWVFEPRFSVIFSRKDPKLAFRPSGIEGVPYPVPTWEAQGVLKESATLDREKRDAAHFGDGFDDTILDADAGGRTANVFGIAPMAVIEASSAEVTEGTIVWSFPDRQAFYLEAVVSLPEGEGEPAVQFTFRPRVDGYFSIGYTGAPAAPLEEVDEIWQPLIWHEKRFPTESFMTLAFRCPLPTTFVTIDGNTIGVVADPEEMPFQPLPTRDNNRFGVVVRNADGLAQPLLFAPVPGGVASGMRKGEDYSFKFRLSVTEGGVPRAFEQVARGLYGFRDYRRNEIASLNETLDNLIDYGMSEHSFFVDTLKGCGYSTDVPDAVKNVSALNPLNMALITGRSDIFEKRAYPILEYLISREKFLFSLDPEQQAQFPSRSMTGPSAPVTELAALYSIFNERSPVFLTLARAMAKTDRMLNLDVVASGDTWQNSLALYRAGGDRRDFERAKRGADEYIAKRITTMQTDFEDPDAGGFFFWTGFMPKWVDLLELYEATGEQRYLEAAHEGARYYATVVWMAPKIPDTGILVNEGGKAPVYWYLARRTKGPIAVREEEVPAWRVSEIGLTAESSGTSAGHRGIFMANYAPWMLRLSGYTGDTFLRDIAKAAVIGRYSNFPGYHMNTARTTVYEKPEYPLRPHDELSYNSFHYNHVWPHASILLDYLVTEVEVRSQGRVRFPSRFIEGYAYLQSKFYGDRPGVFYGEEDVYLWMPQRLLQLETKEINYLSARGEEALFLAFTNQSPETVETSVSLNVDLVGELESSHQVHLWVDNKPAGRTEMSNGVFHVSVPPNGIVAAAVRGLRIEPAFQGRLLSTAQKPWKRDYLEDEFGGVRAMILNVGDGLKRAFVYLQATDADFEEVTLHYEGAGGAERMDDSSYPYEFTVPLNDSAGEFPFHLEARRIDGSKAQSERFRLSRGP